MFFVKRDENGQVISLSDSQKDDHAEALTIGHADIQAFLHFETSDAEQDPLMALNASDNDLARVTEDLIQLLVAKQVIMFTELPKPVQKKLLERERMRAHLREAAPSILDDEGSI